MAHAEIDNFVSKFKSLLSAGVQASLKINALNNEVSVALEANLGSVIDKNYDLKNSPRRGPSYYRRQQRRQQEASEKINGLEVSMNNVKDIAKKVNIVNTEEVNEIMKIESDDEISKINVMMETPVIEIENDKIVAEEVLDERQDTPILDGIGTDVDGIGTEKDSGEECHIAEEALRKTSGGDSGAVESKSEFDATVHGTAIIEDSSNRQVTNEMYKAIWGIIFSKEHIQRNVGKIRVVNVNSNEVFNSKFKHELLITFTVNSSRLWDSPRCYLWKHLCTSEWKLPDGSKVKFVRIHQK